jgi:hypothetical protein
MSLTPQRAAEYLVACWMSAKCLLTSFRPILTEILSNGILTVNIFRKNLFFQKVEIKKISVYLGQKFKQLFLYMERRFQRLLASVTSFLSREC